MKKQPQRQKSSLVKPTLPPIQNWSSYNQSLIERGNVTLWVNVDSLSCWFASERTGQGRPLLYSDSCILVCLVLRTRYHLPLRSAQGFVQGLLHLLGVELPVPSYTQVCRRARRLHVDLCVVRGKGAIDVVLDATGLKIYGEGEWKMRTHGKSYRRTWRKLHLCLDPKSQQIQAMELTDDHVIDARPAPRLLSKVGRVNRVYGDGAYGSLPVLAAVRKQGGKSLIALPWHYGLAKETGPGETERNRLVRARWKAGGKGEWKKLSGYHRRSLVETAISRLKRFFGGSLLSRTWENQQVEAQIQVRLLNELTRCGMPQRAAA